MLRNHHPASQIQIIMKCLWLTVSGTGFLPAVWLFISNMKPDLLNVDSVAFLEEGGRLLHLTPPPCVLSVGVEDLSTL